MASEVPMDYSRFVLSLSRKYSDVAEQVASALNFSRHGSSGTVIIGAILEEYNDSLESGFDFGKARLGDFGSFIRNSFTHDILAQQYADINAAPLSVRMTPSLGDKANYPLLIDIGEGSIQPFTAIRLLEDYVAAHPDSDPLFIKRYETDYPSLRADLANGTSSATAKFAGLMVNEALDWGASNVSNWSSLTTTEKEGFAVFYYNVGKENMEQRLNAAGPDGYVVDMSRTDIAVEYAQNKGDIEEYSSRVPHGRERGESLEDRRAREAEEMETDFDHCFAADTQIAMFDGTYKPIQDIRPGDVVVSFDKDGNEVPGTVTRTFQNENSLVLNFFDLIVTPGHAFYCAAGRFAGKHVPLIDILRCDGAIQKRDGTIVRAATNCVVGSEGDRILLVVHADRPGELMGIRYGARMILADGRDVSISDLIRASGWTLTDAGLIQPPHGGKAIPFAWPLRGPLPRPEDYVLQRSGVTLDMIYAEGAWESIGPQMPAPDQGFATAQPASPAAPAPNGDAMARPSSLDQFVTAMNAVSDQSMTRGEPKPSRKQRRAAAAKDRKVAKKHPVAERQDWVMATPYLPQNTAMH